MKNRQNARHTRLAMALAIALSATAAPAFAQNTTASVSGNIQTATQSAVSDADVTILHVPSGTVSRATTDAQGRYVARGLRVGGPYTITITKDGVSEIVQNVFLQLAENTSVNAVLGNVTEMDAMQVTGTLDGLDVFGPNAMGAGTNISSEQLNSFPSIQRDLQDYARMDPRFSQSDKERGEISAAGQNTRYNSITVDSISVNDTFGLESNNLPTIRQPISIDAIEAVQVNIANYDVTQKGYTGANINAVTKSGTNEFKGSVYSTYRTQDWVRGTDDRGIVFNAFDTEETYGMTFGGPIAKDRLFFFLNYEKTELGGVAPDLGNSPLSSGAITLADITAIQNAAIVRGFTPGDLSTSSADTTMESILGRIDWNISDTQRLAFRFSSTDQSEARLPGFGSRSMSLSSYWYDEEKTIDNYVVELFSDWSDSFATEARVSFRDYESAPIVFLAQPQVQIDYGSSNLRFGAEQFRHTNHLQTDTLNGFFAGNWFLGAHELKVGMDYEKNDIYNLFVESSYGNYRFSSLANFVAGNYSSYLFRTPAVSLDDAAANFSIENVGFFVQDVWSVNNNLTISAGVRYDMNVLDDAVPYNAAADAAFGYRNDETIDGTGLFQPRVGFNYTFDAERPTQLRGGIGLFQGAAANVWMSNSFTNHGQSINVYGCGGSEFLQSCSALWAANPPSANPATQPLIGLPRADVDFLAPGFEQPSVIKFNLAFDHELPWWGMVATAEVLVTQVNNGIFYEHLNLGNVSQPGLDGRDMYWGSTSPSLYSGFFNGPSSNSRSGSLTAFRDVLIAKNTDKGHGENLSVTLQKPFSETSDLAWSIAYAYTDMQEASPLTSSRAISNWRAQAVFNVNEEVISRSPYVNRDRFVGTASYRMNLFGDYKTTFSAFYEGRRGKPYSWVFNNDMNGDGQAGNDLLYVPNLSEVRFTAPAEAQLFWDYIAANGLSAYQGMVVPRNAANSPWVNSVDLRISQEIPGFSPKHRGEIWLDILNVGNLINKDWGHIDEIGFQSDGAQARSFVNYAGIDPVSGQYVYDFVGNEDFIRRDRKGESRWAVQIGFRYRF